MDPSVCLLESGRTNPSTSSSVSFVSLARIRSLFALRHMGCTRLRLKRMMSGSLLCRWMWKVKAQSGINSKWTRWVSDVDYYSTVRFLIPGRRQIKEAIINDPDIKITILCSPGNPTGVALRKSDIKALLEFQAYRGIVVVDEAYIDFTKESDEKGSVAKWIDQYPNLIVTQTLSKGFGLAGIR